MVDDEAGASDGARRDQDVPAISSDPLERGMPSLPRSRSGRIPQWAIDEALGVRPNSSSWRVASPGPGSALGAPGRRQQRKHHRRWARPLVALFFLLLIGGMTVWTMSLRGTKGAPPLADHTGWVTTYTSGPTPGVGSQPEPIGSPEPLAFASNAYRLFGPASSQDSGDDNGSNPAAPAGSAADIQGYSAYDPCRPIHYVVATRDAPPGAQELITAAVDKAHAATGLEFVYDGTTAERPAQRRDPFQPEQYGDRWAPVLIAWSDPTEVPRLAGSVVGLGGSMAVTVRGRTPVYVTGTIELDTPQLRGVLAREGGAAVAQAVIQHELGHVLGLDHVNDSSQLMYPTTEPGITDYQAGDLTGLSLLGQGRCAPEL